MSSSEPPPTARSHWSYWVSAAVVIAGLVTAILWVHEREPPESQGGAALSASSNALPVGFPPAFKDSRPDLSRSPEFVEVCGIGRVRLQPSGDIDLPDKLAASDRWFRQAAAGLAASGNDYDRAVGLYAQSIQAALQAMKDYASARPGCERDEQCMSEWMAAGQQASAAATEQLARHAVASRSPAVYALAFYGCRRAADNPPASGACAQISSAQWAQIDPDNAAPWLYEAGLAARRKDAKAIDEALLRASKARAMRVHNEAPLRFMDPGILPNDDPVAMGMAYYQLAGIWAAFPAPDAVAAQYCGPNATMDGPRRLLCSDLADVLADRSSSLLSMGVGARIGERAGWPPERVAAARDFASAINQVWTTASYDQKDLYTCRTLEVNNKRLSEIFQYGEVGAAKRQIQASGKSVAELAREWKQSQSAKQDGR